ncbi:MAG: sensor histidine kinase, partial [Acidobacteriota bacterium]
YPVRALPPEQTGIARLIVAVALGALLSSALWIGLGVGWAALLGHAPGLGAAPQHLAAALPLLFAVGLLLFLLAVAVHYLLAAIARAHEAERRALAAQVHAREAELRALKAQLDPHFLFNSLNSVAALAGSDPRAARRMCVLLAGFLRKSLSLGAQELVPLSEELYLAETYLAIEQVRFGDRLRVETQVDEDAQSLAVPPLLLQPLLENAIRHGIAHRLEGGTIELTLHRRGAELDLVVRNPCDGDRPAGAASGVGLRNVRGRLEALYGHRAALATREEGGEHRVHIVLPAEPAA